MSTLGRNIAFPIYKGDGTLFHNLVIKKSTSDSVVMSLGDKVTGDVYYKDNTLKCNMDEYILVDGVKYSIVNPPTIVREGLKSANGELNGMTKYSFVFYHPMHMLGNMDFSDVAVTNTESMFKSHDRIFSWVGNFTDYVAKLNKNLQGSQFIVSISDSVDADSRNIVSDVLTFTNNTIADAIKTGYDTWHFPFVVDAIKSGEQYYSQGKRFLIQFGNPTREILDANDQPFVFNFGKGVGLKNNSRTPRNNKIVTRVAGYGSEQNIPYGYPQIPWTGDPSATQTADGYPIYDGIVGGVVTKLIKHPFTRTHLMPSVYVESVRKKVNSAASDYDNTTPLVDYYDAPSTYPNPINLDAPKLDIVEIETIKPELGDAFIVGAIPINDDLTPASGWDDTMDDDGNYHQSYFKITLPQLDFDIYACASITEEMKINMRSGACIGCTFDAQVDWDDYKKNFFDAQGNFLPNGEQRDLSKYPKSNNGSIDLIVKKDLNTYGTLMPNVYQYPAQGDKFVVLGISLPSTYITNAQERLDAALMAHMLDNNVYYYDYPLNFDEDFFYNHTDILSQVRPNSVLRFTFGDEEKSLYIKQITIKYGEGVLPKYDITLTDNIEVVLNQIGLVADDVSRLALAMMQMNKRTNINISNTESLQKYVDYTIMPNLESIQEQLDHVQVTYFGEVVPTTSNYPASSWNTDALKEQHVFDMYYDKAHDKGYEWKNVNNTYQWVEITDPNTLEALRIASQEQDTIDGKRRIFVTAAGVLPTPPYDAGDMWVNATYPTNNTTTNEAQHKYYNDILKCVTPKAKDATASINDWTLASKYTDDTQYNGFITKLIGSSGQTKDAAENAIAAIKHALNEGNTYKEGGLILSNLISLGTGNPTSGTFTPWAGISGIYKTSETDTGYKGHGIAAWFGGGMVDGEVSQSATNAAKSLFRFDGSGYVADGNITWDKNGQVTIQGYQIKVGGSNVATQAMLDNFVSKAFFNRLFTAYDANGNAIVPNDTTTAISNLKILVGTWAEQFLSALGMNSQGGGGTGDVSHIKVSTNPDVYLDPDSDGIIDMSDYVSTIAERNIWNTANANINRLMARVPSATFNTGNELADKAFVNSSISTATATFRGTVTASNDTDAAAATALATISTKDLNDYAFVKVENTPQTGVDKYKRYKYNGTSWVYEFTLNNSSFTSDQWNAINSGINTSLVAKLNGIASGAQVNVIESVKVNGTALSISSKAVDITAVPLAIITGADDLKAIEGLSGTSGFLKKTAANTWALDTTVVLNTRTITAGNGLTGGGDLSENRTINVASANAAITVNADNIQLNVINDYITTTNNSIIPLAAARGKDLNDRLAILEAMFTREGVGTAASPYVIKANYGLYTNQFLSSLGQNSQGGSGDFDEEQMWIALGTDVEEKVIDSSHIPDTSSLYGYLKASSLNGYATQSWVNSRGFLTSHQNIYALTLKADGTTVTTFTPNSAAASLNLVAGTNISLTRGTNAITISNTYSYTLPLAASGTRGGVQIGYSENGKNYAVQLSGEKMYVNVPWENTTYSAGAGISISSGTIINNGVRSITKHSTTAYDILLINTGGTIDYLDLSHQHSYWEILDKPTDLEGFGLTDELNALYVTALGTSGNYLTWTKNGSTSNITIPYATLANTATTAADTSNTLYLVGVTSDATTTLKRDTSISVKGSALNAGSVTTTGNVSVGGTFGVTGATTLTGLLTANGNIVTGTSNGAYIQIGAIKLVYDSTNNALKVIKSDNTSANLYATGAVSALGANSSGGGGGGMSLNEVWQSLTNEVADNYSTTKIHTNHIPDMAGIYGYLKQSALNNYVTSVKVGSTAYNPSSGVVSLPAYPTVPTNVSQLTNDSGYVTSSGSVNYATSAGSAGSVAWGNVSGKPTTVSGYGITDAVFNISRQSDGILKYYVCSTANYLDFSHNHSYWDILDRPVDLEGFGLTSELDASYAKVSGSNATGTWGISVTGNASTATKLQTARTIWGQSFDGSANISGAITGATTISASSNVSIGGTLGVTGATTLSSTLSVASGITLTTTKKIYFGDTSHYLELNSTGFHFSHGVYSDSFMSALGANSGGGGGGDFSEDQMWAALQGNTGTYANEKINANHIPDTSSLYGYLKSSSLSGYATQSWVNTQLGNYLPLTGGTLSGSNCVLNIKSSGVNSLVYFLSAISGNTANRAAVGYYNNVAFLSNENTYARIGVKDDGTPVYWNNATSTNEKTLWHAGNLKNVSQLTNDSGYITSSGSCNYATTSGSCSGNAATATKLQTARTIWGQSFDGSANVSGDMANVGKITANGTITSTNSSSAAFLASTATNTWSCFRYKSGSILWDIGTNDSAGHIYSTGGLGIRDAGENNNGIYIKHNSSSYGKLVIQVPSGECSLGFNIGGYNIWTIGYTGSNDNFGWYYGDAYKSGTSGQGWKMTLDSSGNLTAVGEVTASSDARKKNIISDTKFNVRDIASARSVLYEWNDGRDKYKKVHGGSIAQDWLGKADSFLNQDNDGFYSINYGALALCSAITIAREVLKHSDEIDRLKQEISYLKAKVAELEERRVA